MSSSKVFIKKTKKGNLLNVVREHYLRDDISNGIGSVLESSASEFLIPDTNVILHQISCLESPLIKNVIILQTVLDEAKNQNISLYTRLRNLISDDSKHFFVFTNEHHRDTYIERKQDETMNDRNDRAIRVAAAWYMKLTNQQIPILLITNDKANLKKAQDEKINAKRIQDYVATIKDHPELMDLLHLEGDNEVENKSSKFMFRTHLPLNDLMMGIKNGKYFQSCLVSKRENCNEGRIMTNKKGFEVIYIQGYENMNRSIDGDIVAVELLPKSQWKKFHVDSEAPDMNSVEKADEVIENEEDVPATGTTPCGQVVGIIKRNWRVYCGSIDENADENSDRVFFIPMDRRIPRIKIHTKQTKELLTKRISVVIDVWNQNQRYPEGHYTGTIGDIGDPNVESKVILMEHNIPHYEFSKQVLDCLPPDDWKITKEMIKERKDLRSLNVFSIDPPGCKDIDDALHCLVLPNGNYQIGIHIADVTFYVLEGTALDEEAAKRATSTYLVDRRIDMLPKLLTETLCSLRSGVDRLAFSVLLELNDKAEILSREFCKSVIHSKSAFTYGEAQTVIDDPTSTNYRKELLNLNKIAKLLRQKRVDDGALNLASPAVKFDIDTETLNPTDVATYQLHETNSLVEEFMLLGNIEVSKRICKDFPKTACLRRHPAPNTVKFTPLLKSLATVHQKLDIDTSKRLATSLDQCEIEQDPYFNVIVRILTTRCMEQAVYFVSGDIEQDQYFHYGLATPYYTHFTSPIRRYADILVHRQLGACIGTYSKSEVITDRDKMRDLINKSNKQHTSAQYAQRSSIELYTNIYFKNKEVIEEAYVTRTAPDSVILLIPRYGIEAMVPLEKEKYDYDVEKECLTNKSTSDSIRVFQKVKAKIFVHVSQHHRSKCVIEIIETQSFQKRKEAPKSKQGAKKKK
jgi:exosome complex exonuclease DIS3/RRP44